MHRPWFAFPVALSLLVASLAGCGSSDSSGETAAPGGTGGAAGAGGGSAGTGGAAAAGGAAAGAGGATAGAGGDMAGGAGGDTAGGAAGAGGDMAGGAGGDTAGGAAGAGGDMPFAPAPHGKLPQAVNSGGAVLKDVQIVTITFAGYAYADKVEAWGDFVVSSNWMKSWTSEYGIGTGAHVGKVRLTDPAPATLDDATIGPWLAGLVKAGTVPAPPDLKKNDYLYMIYYPKGTKITGQTGNSCTDYGGYHESTATTTSDTKLSFAVNMTCYGVSDAIFTASHELNEAVMDAQPQSNPAWGFLNLYSPWSLFGSETADVCENLGILEGGFVNTRVWSNANALADDDPCIPKPANDIMYGVTATPAITQFVKAGSVVTYTLQAWSEQPIAPWKLQTLAYNGSFNPKTSLSATTVNNGDTPTLTVTVPSTAKTGDTATVLIYSRRSNSDYHFWPVAIYVK